MAADDLREAVRELADADLARFWSRVTKTDGCWLWTGPTNHKGYGRFWLKGRRLAAHRVSFLLAGEVIPEGLVLDHLCRVRHCVNPAHLRPVTNRENVLIGVGLSAANARKTHCPRNHEYTPENTAIGTTGGGRLSRVCRTCKNAQQRAYKARKRAER